MTILARYGTFLRCYDNGGRTFDRYTILPPRWAAQYRERGGLFQGLGASEYPFTPQGFGQHITAVPGPHLGRRVRLDALPEQVRRFAAEEWPEYNN